MASGATVASHLEELMQSVSGPLNLNTAKAVYREVSSAAASLVQPVTVAYVGEPGWFGHMAALQLVRACCLMGSTHVHPVAHGVAWHAVRTVNTAPFLRVCRGRVCLCSQWPRNLRCSSCGEHKRWTCARDDVAPSTPQRRREDLC